MNAPMSHSEHTVHLNAAGTGRMSAAARTVLAESTALDDRFGPYALEEHLGAVLHTGIHERLGGLLGVPAGHTALFTGASEAFDSFVSRVPVGPGDRIWTTPHEDVARLTTLFALRDRTRCALEVVPLNGDGDLDLDWMRAHLDEGVALVSVPHVSQACGTVNPIEAIGRLLAPHRARYAVDASYSAGLLPIHATRIGCDQLTADAWRFLRGPYGVAFAYAAPQPDTGGAWDTTSPAPRPAAVAALNTALESTPAHPVATGADSLLAGLRAAVEQADGIELAAAGRARAGLLAFRDHEVPAGLIRRGLARRGVIVSKTVGQETPLHPWGRTAGPALRACVDHDTTPQDIARFAGALREVLREERENLIRPSLSDPLPTPAFRGLAVVGGRRRP